MLQIFGRSAKQGKRILQIGLATQNTAMGKELMDFVGKRDGVELQLIKSSSVTPKEFPKNIGIYVYDLSATGETSRSEEHTSELQSL